MKLKPIYSSPSVKLAGREPGELHADLTASAEDAASTRRGDRALARPGAEAPRLM